jgi:hypothetical protein
LPDGIPSWATFLGQIDALESTIVSENESMLAVIAAMTEQATAVMQDAVNRLTDLDSSIRVF